MAPIYYQKHLPSMLKIVPINFLMVRIGQMLKTEPKGVSQACLVTWMKVGALTIEGLR